MPFYSQHVHRDAIKLLYNEKTTPSGSEMISMVARAMSSTPHYCDPIQKFMKEFLKEEVVFEMPPGVRSWK